MKVYQMLAGGAPNSIQLAEVPTPVPAAGEVLLRTKAISINPVDVKTRDGGGVYGLLDHSAPIVLGWDISGEVIAVGDGQDRFKIGDEVFGMVNFPGHGKVYAEYVAAPADQLAHKPASVTHQEAAASTLAALTAQQILNRHVKAGDRMLIQAAAGGVGHFVVQIAKLMGAYVIGTASAKNEAYLASIGLDEFVNYRTTDFSEVLSGLDFVFDTQAGETLEKTIKIVRDGGTIISIPASIPEGVKALAAERNIAVDFELVESNGADMDQIAGWLANGDVKPYIFQDFPFSEMEAALAQVASGSTRGKVVVSL
jgi:NADPH:quinone reductase-like Zn-dependent oxidoreductase